MRQPMSHLLVFRVSVVLSSSPLAECSAMRPKATLIERPVYWYRVVVRNRKWARRRSIMRTTSAFLHPCAALGSCLLALGTFGQIAAAQGSRSAATIVKEISPQRIEERIRKLVG